MYEGNKFGHRRTITAVAARSICGIMLFLSAQHHFCFCFYFALFFSHLYLLYLYCVQCVMPVSFGTAGAYGTDFASASAIDAGAIAYVCNLHLVGWHTMSNEKRMLFRYTNELRAQQRPSSVRRLVGSGQFLFFSVSKSVSKVK